MEIDLDELESSEALDKQVEEREKLHADICKTLSTPHGQRVIDHILAKCHLFRLSYTGNAQTHFNEGERSIGLSIFADIESAVRDNSELLSVLQKLLIRGSM